MLAAMMNLTGERVLVVGSGPVGRRKLVAATAAGAVVRMVTLDAIPMPKAAEWIVEPYRETHLDGVRLAFAAATPAVNRQVVADGKRRGIWVNSATEPETGTLTLPAVRTFGNVTFAVSTHGAAPAFAAVLCEEIAKPFDDRLAAFVEALRRERERLQIEVEDEAERRERLRLMSTWEAYLANRQRKLPGGD